MTGNIAFITDGSLSANLVGQQVIELASLWNAQINASYLLSLNQETLLGDEWMTGQNVRNLFFKWFKKNLIDDAQSILDTFYNLAANLELRIITNVIIGNVKNEIITIGNNQDTVLLALPHPRFTRPAAEGGLNYNLNHLTAKIKCPLLIGPGKK